MIPHGDKKARLRDEERFKWVSIPQREADSHVPKEEEIKRDGLFLAFLLNFHS